MGLVVPAGFFGSGFDPLTLSPSLWLSDTGSDPATWPDLSGNARHATQATAAYQPSIVSSVINGKQVRRFDGNNDMLSLPAQLTLSGGMFFAVLNLRSLKTYGVIFNSTSSYGLHSSANGIYQWGASFGTCRVNSGTGFVFPAFGAENTNYFSSWCVFSAVPSDFLLAHLGALSGSSPNMDIAEILAFTSSVLPSESNRLLVEQWLMSKYGIT